MCLKIAQINFQAHSFVYKNIVRADGNIRLSIGEFMKLLFVSLGCDKNLVDSEEMLGLLTGNGFEIVDDETQAEVIVVNTCCFINDAKEESVNTILEMAEYKKEGTWKVLIVTGCMAQRY